MEKGYKTFWVPSFRNVVLLVFVKKMVEGNPKTMFNGSNVKGSTKMVD